MDVFRQSWSLEKLIKEQNTTNITSFQAESNKIFANKTKESSTVTQISAFQSELVSSDVFETTLTPGKHKSGSPKKNQLKKK